MLELNFEPFPELETARLLLRKITPEDAPAIQDMRSNEEVMQYIDRPRMRSVKEAEDFIGLILDTQARNEGILWVIADKNDQDRLIGTIGYWRIMKEHYRAEIGYMLHPDHWGKGIMKEAAAKVIEYAFVQTAIHSIEANTSPGNKASQALLDSLGFIQEGYFRENYFYDGKFGDSVIFSLVKK